MIPSPPQGLEKEEGVEVHVHDPDLSSSTLDYTLYKWRFPGVFGLVVLNIAAGLCWPWFGSISAQSMLAFGRVPTSTDAMCSCH